MILYENDWQAINNLLLKMYSEETDTLFEGELMKQLKFLIPYDKASFFLHDHESRNGILQHDTFEQTGFDADTYEKFIPMIPDKIPHSWANFYERSIVIRDSDVIQDEEERYKNEYFKLLLVHENIKFGLTISLAHQGMRVGILTLFRDRYKEDFSEREVRIAENLMDHIACYAYKTYNLAALRTGTTQAKTVANVIKKYGISERETEVLRLVLVGHSTKEICNRLSITETTTKKHLCSIYSKFNIHSKGELFKILEIDLDS